MRRFAQVFSGGGLSSQLPDGLVDTLTDAPDRYNVAKGKPASILYFDDEVRVGEFQWGLVPRWSKTRETPYTTVTARLDNAPRSRMYRDAWTHRRCLVPMTGYYKWDRSVRPHRPYFIQASDGQVLLAAGLWETWDKEDPPLRTFTILTAPNDAIPMPLVPDGPIFVPHGDWRRWIAGDPWAPSAFLKSARQPSLEAYRVSRKVVDPGKDDYTLLEPAEMMEDAEEAREEVWADEGE